MANIVVLGCSLSRQPGYADYLAQQEHYVENLAVSAGGNALQQFRMSQSFMEGKISKDTVVIWQITAIQRKHLVINQFQQDICHGDHNTGPHDWIPLDVSFAEKSKIFLISNNKLVPDYTDDESVHLQMLAVDIYRWSLLVSKMIVVIGWNTIADSRYLQRFTSWLRDRDVIVLDKEQSIVEWCRKNNQDFVDDGHPSQSGYINWCQNNLEKII